MSIKVLVFWSRYTHRKGVKETLTICTMAQTNELILANDWRENVMDPKQEDKSSKINKQNLLPVEVIRTADNKPHILYVIGQDPVYKCTELLQDYGGELHQCTPYDLRLSSFNMIFCRRILAVIPGRSQVDEAPQREGECAAARAAAST